MSNRGNRTSGVSSGRGTRWRSTSHTQPRDFVDYHPNTEEGRASNHASMVSNGRTVQEGKKTAQQYRSFNQRQKPVYEYRPKNPSSSGAAELQQHVTRVKEDEITCGADRTCLDSPDGSLDFGLVDKDHNAILNPQPISMDAQSARHMKQKPEPARGLQPNIDLLGGTDHALSNPRKIQVEETIPEAGTITLKQSDHVLADKAEHTLGLQPKICLFGGADHELPNPRKLQVEETIPEAGPITLKQSDHGLADKDNNATLNVLYMENKSHSPLGQNHFLKTDIRDLGHSDDVAVFKTFDICPPKPAGLMKLNRSLFEMNKERRNVNKLFLEGRKETLLRSGMVLLENYLSLDEQVKIVKTCQKLGMGPGGFYQPSYSEGAQLRLKMMCLGKVWDPESRNYLDRCFDDAEPPSIPDEFVQLVSKAIKDSRALTQRDFNEHRVDDVPLMKPNICIMNFYSASGRLGLHQDRDESQESLSKGLPVVSFSIGDSCEFVYGDDRDVDMAKSITLKSGDVILFGGKSRLIFHGVTSISADTAPKTVLEETNLRQGRLNLTFREY